MEYKLLDSGNMRKLEAVGEYRLIRPALNAFWTPQLPGSEWEKADAVYERNSTGSGKWIMKRPLPADGWKVQLGDFALHVKATGFGHLGFFAEQLPTWKFFSEFPDGEHCSMLNLFAYSGIGSMAMAQSGAKVVHLDAARGMVEWGKSNLELNPGIPQKISWIVDDVSKFCKREERREHKYNAIALDPPSFGRGASGQVWKIESDLPELLRICAKLFDFDHYGCVALSCHSPGFSPAVLEYLLADAFGSGHFTSGEMMIPSETGRALSAGIMVRWENGKQPRR
ncbi:MAG: class I SAM-dependent methyltransferase [Victivallaceae bacterium]|nr:class I SAM-dependent methyltransferase [Victivallaceae bacterium]